MDLSQPPISGWKEKQGVGGLETQNSGATGSAGRSHRVLPSIWTVSSSLATHPAFLLVLSLRPAPPFSHLLLPTANAGSIFQTSPADGETLSPSPCL